MKYCLCVDYIVVTESETLKYFYYYDIIFASANHKVLVGQECMHIARWVTHLNNLDRKVVMVKERILSLIIHNVKGSTINISQYTISIVFIYIVI